MDLDELEIVQEKDATVMPPPPPAVDFSALTDAEKAVVGGELEKQVQDDSAQVMARYLRIGRNLYIISKNRLYEKMGHASFDTWRAQPELNLARATSYALMKVFETFVERLNIPTDKLEGLDWSKLYAVSPFVNPNNVDEFLDKVRLLSRTDLQAEISMARAIASGQTPSQAAAQQSVLDLVRECCPIGCGQTCQKINDDNDAAVMAFKKFLGGWRALSAKISALGRAAVRQAQHEPEKSEVPPSSETVPSQSHDLPPSDLG